MAFNFSSIFRRDKLKEAFNRIGAPKTYKCLLNQSGTSAPTVTVLHNSLGFVPTWIREGAGVYRIDETFDGSKVFGFSNYGQYAATGGDANFYFDNGEFNDLNQFYLTTEAGTDLNGDYQIAICIEVYD